MEYHLKCHCYPCMIIIYCFVFGFLDPVSVDALSRFRSEFFVHFLLAKFTV